MKLFGLILAATAFAQNVTDTDYDTGILGIDERRRTQEQIQ